MLQRRLPPGERAAIATRLRGLSGGLQRTANAIQDAAELHHAAEQVGSIMSNKRCILFAFITFFLFNVRIYTHSSLIISYLSII